MSGLAAAWRVSALRRLLTGAGEPDILAASRVLAWVPAWTGASTDRLRAILAPAAAAVVVLFALAPKWTLVPGRESLFFRPEDPLILALLGIALLVRRPPAGTAIDLPIVLYILAVSASAARGILAGTVQRPLFAALYLMRLLEYFAVAGLVVNAIERREQARALLRVFFYAAVAVALYGIAERLLPYPYESTDPEFIYRTYERGFFHRDANHVAAFLTLAAAVGGGLLLSAPRPRVRLALGAALASIAAAILLTCSRSAYLACGLALAVLIAVHPSRRWALAGAALVAAALLVAMPPDVARRLQSIALAWGGQDDSMSDRVANLQAALQTIDQAPLLGLGLAARPRVFYENFYLQQLVETGVIGALLFGLILLRMAVIAWSLARDGDEWWVRGLGWGYLAGLAGLCLEGCTLVVFLLTRAAGPFWFLSGILLWLWHERRPTVSCA